MSIDEEPADSASTSRVATDAAHSEAVEQERLWGDWCDIATRTRGDPPCAGYEEEVPSGEACGYHWNKLSGLREKVQNTVYSI